MDSLLDTATLGGLAAGFAAVKEYVPLPYMDEIFHIPQTQTYCGGKWLEWDDKITTPPGLYVLGVLAGKIAGSCSTEVLRSVNIVGITFGSWAVTRLIRKSVFSYLLTFPLLYFFSLLYYTDVWSTLLVLIGLGLTLRKYHWASAAVFSTSLAFRQTNIIWAGFAAVCAIMDLDTDFGRLDARSGTESLFYQFTELFQNIFDIKNFPTWLPYTFTAGLFALFLYANGGITMGDKTNHQMSLNFAQLLYFCMFGTFFSAPILLKKTTWIQWYIKKKLSLQGFVWYVIEVVAIYLIATKLMVIHPFILADNRHYTFYLWRRVIYRPDGLSVFMIPIYHLCISWMLEAPFCLHTLFFWLGLAGVLVPSPLIEPRYYMVGYLIWRLFIARWNITRCELAWNTIISVTTTFVFCKSKTHFMW